MTHIIKPVFSALQAQDFSNVEKLYRIYGRYAYSLAMQVSSDTTLAEDIVHEAFLQYWREFALQKLKSVSFFAWLLGEIRQGCHERLPWSG